jgi:AcrR family transcriptional regulator
MSKRLGKQEWISAGLRALAAQGAEAVRVERLAEALRVTKGSFYWHFKDRNALLEALLDAWKTRATSDIIAEVENRGGDARARLRALFSITQRSDGGLDQAIRNWAEKDSNAATALEEIDRRRIAYVVSLFKEYGFMPAEASARARLAYHARIGQFTLRARARPRKAIMDEFEIIFEMLTRRS